MSRTKFPELFQFLAGYFHQDWKCDHENEDEVIQLFIENSSPETLSLVKSELNSVLISFPDEEELKSFLFEEIGCSYYYPYAWPSGKAWLEHILEMLEQKDRNVPV
ncbi:contact-dependent growth inhibition system immunity protein [Pseudomonas sp. NPDC087346]|uniref:contact-dependent growth inhibition system immunity protein n=1 Tax=Pseudomonas sp. NPDC087346 TaxID=3364438 RepID=UPI003814E88E